MKFNRTSQAFAQIYFTKTCAIGGVVLAKTGLGNELERVDKKGTIKRKIIEFNLEKEPQDEDIYQILFKIYPEIFF